MVHLETLQLEQIPIPLAHEIQIQQILTQDQALLLHRQEVILLELRRLQEANRKVLDLVQAIAVEVRLVAEVTAVEDHHLVVVEDVKPILHPVK